VLDDGQYADTYEMRAWTQFVGDLNLVLLHPGQDHLAMVLDQEGERLITERRCF
jgi:hypothetical protein